MPGMNGRALAETLSPQRPEMKVLYMSGYSDGVIAKHGIVEAEYQSFASPLQETNCAECRRCRHQA